MRRSYGYYSAKLIGALLILAVWVVVFILIGDSWWQLAEREYPLTSRLRQRGHGESWMSTQRGHARVPGCRIREEETLQRSASSEYSLVKAERLSPYESLWVDSPEALADSAGSASTSI